MDVCGVCIGEGQIDISGVPGTGISGFPRWEGLAISARTPRLAQL